MLASAFRRPDTAHIQRPDLLVAALREGVTVFDLALPPAAADAARGACLGLMRTLSASKRRLLYFGRDGMKPTADETAVLALVTAALRAPEHAARLAEWLVRRPGQAALLADAARLARALRCG